MSADLRKTSFSSSSSASGGADGEMKEIKPEALSVFSFEENYYRSPSKNSFIFASETTSDVIVQSLSFPISSSQPETHVITSFEHELAIDDQKAVVCDPEGKDACTTGVFLSEENTQATEFIETSSPSMSSSNNERGGQKPNSLEKGWEVLQSHVAKAWDGFRQPVNLFTLFEKRKQSSVPLGDSPLGFSFSPAGLLLPYHLGVSECLKHFGVLTASTPIAGASAGALAVVTIACDVSTEDAMQVFFRVEDNIRRRGAANRLHSVLSHEMDNLLPYDAHLKLNLRSGCVTVAYTHVWPFLNGQFVSKFRSREDVKECLNASCNIPFYFSKWPTVNCRGQPSVDGYFASSRRFGCPETSAPRDVLILPFSAKTVRLPVAEGDCICPDLQLFDDILTKETAGRFPHELYLYLETFPAPKPGLTCNNKLVCSDPFSTEDNVKEEQETEEDEKSSSFASSPVSPTPSDGNGVKDNNQAESIKDLHSESALKKLAGMWGIKDFNEPLANLVAGPSHTVITSDFPKIPVLKFTVHELLKMALDATSDDAIVELYDLGRSDAYRWLCLETLRVTDPIQESNDRL